MKNSVVAYSMPGSGWHEGIPVVVLHSIGSSTLLGQLLTQTLSLNTFAGLFAAVLMSST